MKRYRILLGALIVGTILATSFQPVDAGRMGGRGTFHAMLFPSEIASFDVALAWGDPGVVTAYTLGRSDLELVVYDGDGNVWVGSGLWGRRATRINVYRTGTFRIEIRNVGAEACNFVVHTN